MEPGLALQAVALALVVVLVVVRVRLAVRQAKPKSEGLDDPTLHSVALGADTLVVREAAGVRELVFRREHEVVHSREATGVSVGRVGTYVDAFQFVFEFSESPKRALFIGGGGGSAPRQFLKCSPTLEVDVVEQQAAVLAAARDFFDFKEGPRLRIHRAEGRQFLVEHPEAYDVIVVDASGVFDMPYALLTYEFLELVKSRLGPNGVVAFNLIGALHGERAALYRAVLATHAAVFGRNACWLCPIPEDDENLDVIDPDKRRNVVLFASALAQPQDTLRARLEPQAKRLRLPCPRPCHEAWPDREISTASELVLHDAPGLNALHIRMQ